MKLCFNSQSNIVLEGYADAHLANDETDRKSMSGYYFMVYGSLVSWKTQKQHTVSLSSTEAEFIFHWLTPQQKR